MSRVHELARGHKRLRALIEFALRDNWDVTRTPGGHLKFVKPGLPPIYTSSTPRTDRNTRAQLLRAARNHPAADPKVPAHGGRHD